MRIGNPAKKVISPAPINTDKPMKGPIIRIEKIKNKANGNNSITGKLNRPAIVMRGINVKTFNPKAINICGSAAIKLTVIKKPNWKKANIGPRTGIPNASIINIGMKSNGNMRNVLPINIGIEVIKCSINPPIKSGIEAKKLITESPINFIKPINEPISSNIKLKPKKSEIGTMRKGKLKTKYIIICGIKVKQCQIDPSAIVGTLAETLNAMTAPIVNKAIIGPAIGIEIAMSNTKGNTKVGKFISISKI